MRIGLHVSISGGIEKTPLTAMKLGCECFQMFARPPQGGFITVMSEEKTQEFRDNLKKSGINNFYIHAPYFINFASINNRIFYGGIKAIREDLELGSALGAKYLMTHLGSAKEREEKDAIKKVAEGIEKVLDEYKGTTKLLIENSAGAGKIMGDAFEEINAIIKKVKNKDLAGICFDTAHAFESGYDFRTPESAESVFENIEETIGINAIKLIHINESMTDLGSHKDRHANIGKGKIGESFFRRLMRDERFKDIDCILETPVEGEEEDMRKMKEYRIINSK